MEITLETRPAAALETDALVTYVFEEEQPARSLPSELGNETALLARKLAESGELTGKSLEMTLLHGAPGLKASRLLIVGAGKQEKWGTPELRKLAGAGLRYLKSRAVKQFAFLPQDKDRKTAGAEAIAEGLLVADLEADRYKTDKKNNKKIESVSLAGFAESGRKDAESGLVRGRIIAESQNFARELILEPSNRMTPRILAERAQQMAREAGLACEILDEKRIAELKMGALLSVAQGSVEPPRMIVITYTPQNARTGAPVIGLVGKGVTFDTGGISIKPADNMDKMKYDMAGGATMIGVMRALARLKPAMKVIAIVPATENMPGGRAQKPGDVQTAMSGKTIEVLNTDAEGRLILADGITYAKQLGATYLVDAATLTGAVVVALSNVNVGVFGSDEAFTKRFLDSARSQGEKMWPLPMDDEYAEYIKSNIADIQNIGSGKGGGATIGAMFLREFTGDTPWIHLDIAGTAWLDDNKPWAAKGPSGVAVRTLVDLVMNFDAVAK